VADYGVNIAVAVKNSQAITKLSRDTKTLSGQIDNVNKNIENYSNLVGKAVVNSTANFSRALQDAAENLNKVALNGDKATQAAREFLDAQLLSNQALEEQKRLVREVFLAGRPVQATPFGPQPFSPQKQLADEGKARARLLAIQADKESGLRQERFQATSDFLNKMHNLEISLGKKTNSIEIDNIIKEFEIKERFEKELFDNAIKRDKEEGRRFMEQLGFRKTAELRAIEEVDKARKKAAGEAITLIGQTSPIGGAVGIPGSPAALRAAERAQRLRSAQSSALIGGAFPLLFGQGLGASIGGGLGGFGGGMIGGQFGFGVSLIGTQIGSMFDQFVSEVAVLGQALRDPTEALSALEEAGYRVSESIKTSVQKLIETGKAYEAHRIVLEEIERTLGPGAVGQLQAYKNETERLQDQYNELKAALAAELLPAMVGTVSIINELIVAFKALVDSPVGQFIQMMSRGMIGMFFPGLNVSLKAFEMVQERGRTLGKAAAGPSLAPDLVESDRLKALNKEEEQRAIMRKAEKKHQQEMKRLEGERAAAQRKASQDRLQAELDYITLQERIINFEQLQRQKENAALQQKQDLETSISLLRIEYMKTQDELNSLGLDEISKLDITREQINAIFEIEKKLLKERQEQEVSQAKSIKNLKLIDDKYFYLLGNLEAQRDLMLDLNDLEQKRAVTGAILAEGFTQETLEEMFSVEQSIDKLIEKYPLLGQAADAAANMMTFGIQSFVDGTKTAEEVFADFLRSIADMLMRTAQQMIAQYIVLGVARAFGLGTTPSFPSFQSGMNAGIPSVGDYGGMNLAGNFGGFRANGGPVGAGQAYLVGERGPELFVPGAQGNIVPNNAMGGSNIVVNVDASGSQAQGDSQRGKQLGAAIGAAVQAELIKQKRPGGLLAG
jgi:hypothetical protein